MNNDVRFYSARALTEELESAQATLAEAKRELQDAEASFTRSMTGGRSARLVAARQAVRAAKRDLRAAQRAARQPLDEGAGALAWAMLACLIVFAVFAALAIYTTAQFPH